ncbi:CAM kinase, SNF1/AMK1 family ToxPK1 [Besnoitia besnoiti]|uniref:CAM kinase, SNF1/AMK1 family ToxPK1 n=1 Tax=Besnoitia besnoiti TaxID=94643 RepID=A0A2A9MDA4_BESBE|nr:CAM kinase, SNF1/AMK1 family ToxPK1 [Besnoitia besnoiti]PFH36478.1 CAM kinase, SNF1/AMK1 family ToxPK1 [Besnoitia besnoiti]
MLGFPQLDVGDLEAIHHGWKSILVASNGAHGSDPVQLKFPPDTPFQTFLDWSGPKVNVTPARRAFTESGDEIQEFDQILDDDVVYISKGEDFCKGGADKATDVIGGYVVKELLGEGGFGRVMKAIHPETGEVVAIKLINKRSFSEITDADRVFVEIQALRDLSHKHVIKMKDVVDNPKYICFIMEYATNGELRDYVSKRTRLKEDEARQFFEQIIKGVHYCHSKNIVHRDLKLENILLDEGNQCKIADFGLSHFVVDSHATVTEGGTQAYLAPEVWNGQSKNSSPFQLDVWALGVILFGMTHGRLPFERPDRHTVERLKTEGLPFDSSASPALKKAITAMLHPDPRKRIRISDLMNDAWLRQSLPWEDARESLERGASGNYSSKTDSSNPSRPPSQDGPSFEPVPPAGTTIDDAVNVDRSVLKSWEARSQSPASSRIDTSPKESLAQSGAKRPSRPRLPDHSVPSTSLPPHAAHAGAKSALKNSASRGHSSSIPAARLSADILPGRRKLGSHAGSPPGSTPSFSPLPSKEKVAAPSTTGLAATPPH